MSYDFQQGNNRPGFTEVPNSFTGSPAAPQYPPQPQQYQQPQTAAPQQYQQAPAPSAPPQGQYGSQPTTGGNPGYTSTGNPGYSTQNSGGSSNGGYPSNSRNNGGGSGGYGGSGSGGWKGSGGGSGGGGWKGGGGGKGFRPQLTPEQLANMKLPKMAVMTGNFKAPDQLVPIIREMGDLLQQHGFTVRASNMDGFDKFVINQVRNCEMHIPWKGFGEMQEAASSFNTDEVKEFSKRFLPEWENIKDSQRAFYCKNTRLVLGKRLDQPCQIAIIWSEDGVEGPSNRSQYSGHAGHTAAICHAMRIPVINISNPDAVQRLRRFLEG